MPRDKTDDIIRMQRQFRSFSERYRERVNYVGPLYRRFFVGGALAALVAIVTLSTAARTPYFRTNSPTWHTSKAARMAGGQRESVNEAQACDSPAYPSEQAPTRIFLPDWEVLLPKLPPILQPYHFRPPPLV